MRGETAALRDLIVDEKPDVIDLFCYELIDEEVEEEPEVEFQPPPAYETVSFVGGCGVCHSDICFIVNASREAIRTLQSLLLQELQFLCYECAKAQIDSNHG